MAYTLVKMMLPSSKYDIKSPTTMTPTSITVHNTGSFASAKNEMTYMVSNNNKVSYHYAVDDINVYQGISENRVSYHSGTKAGNYSSISVEICYSEYKDDAGKAKFLASEKNAALFIATRLKAYGWGTDKLKRHYDWSGKNCPEKTMQLGWDRFVKMVQTELDKLKGSSSNTTKSVNYTVEVTAESGLNCRSEASTNGTIITTYAKGTKLTISKENSDSSWGYTGKGWINLSYTKKVATTSSTTTTSTFKSYKVITQTNLNYRESASASGKLLGTYTAGTEVTISKENSNGTWGYTGKGWINLSYTEKVETKTVSYKVKVNTASLNCRATPSTKGDIITSYKSGTQLTITKENKDGTWGYTGKGWISLSYTKKVTTVTIAKKNFAVGAYKAYVQVSTTEKGLNIRTKAVTGTVIDSLSKGTKTMVYTIVKGSDGNFWGSINSAGTKWICLAYTTPISYTTTV